MGCDYYICKYLEVTFENVKKTLYIEIESDRGYFNFSLDEDDIDYDKKYREYVEEKLKPVMKDIVIYENGQFISKNIETKYRYLIDSELKKYIGNSTSIYNTIYQEDWKNIVNIVKKETRYERD